MAENEKLRNKVKEQQIQLNHLQEKIKRISGDVARLARTREVAQAERKIKTNSNVFKSLTNHMVEKNDLCTKLDKSCQP